MFLLFIKYNKRKQPRTCIPNEDGVQDVALMILSNQPPVVQDDQDPVVQDDLALVVLEDLPPVVLEEVDGDIAISTPKKYVKFCASKLTPNKKDNLMSFM
jgi:hypothetical protein